jgi:FkbM family methyltransferase
MIHTFNRAGASYCFDSENNKEIPNFEWFMQAIKLGDWESNTFTTFLSVKDPNKWALDIGGWIGPTAIWLSQNFKSVVVVEADGVALSALKANLKTSNCNNCLIIDKPIYSESGKQLWFGTNGFRAGKLGESTSQLRVAGKATDIPITTISIKDILDEKGREDLAFIKVDIEGGEEFIIPALFEEASEIGSPIWLSFHISWWHDKNIERFKEWFRMSSNVDANELIKKLEQNPMCDVLFKF